MNPARSPTAAQASQEEATRTGSGRGRRIFPKRSPGPHRKGRVTWDLGRTFRRPFLVPHACGLRGWGANRRSALPPLSSSQRVFGRRALGQRRRGCALPGGGQVSPRAHPAGARVLRNKVTEKTAGTHDWVQACRFSEAAGGGGCSQPDAPPARGSEIRV